ncbi:MAG: hypothetical protein NZ899_00660 [Thermoguttaceae bacterium]|nr:hypothetical protein [Thermoguttaceae bacterium]MDW8077406.1 hypothetical protein [Thermoguttaceae bacterium]
MSSGSWEISEGLPGQDSFLDIVANIVGILIILGIVVGIRAQRAPVAPSQLDPDLPRLHQVASEKAREAAKLRQEIARLEATYQSLEQEKAFQQKIRDRLALEVAALQKMIAIQSDRAATLSDQAWQLQLELQERLGYLRELEAQKSQLQQVVDNVTQITHYPAPVAKFVDTKEVHFQLQSNRVAHIPLDRLIEQLKERAKLEASRLLSQSEWTDVVGPEGGFQLRFILRRYDVPINIPGQGRGTASYVRVEHWVLLPTSPQLGEPLEKAIQPDSQFWRTVNQYNPKEYTITLWVYPESFEGYRQLRDRLHAAGYTCAARPLPAGVPISGSPRGSRSAAQ